MMRKAVATTCRAGAPTRQGCRHDGGTADEGVAALCCGVEYLCQKRTGPTRRNLAQGFFHRLI